MTTGERGCVVFRLLRAEQWLYLYVDNGWHNMIGVSFRVLCRSRLLIMAAVLLKRFLETDLIKEPYKTFVKGTMIACQTGTARLPAPQDK